MVKGGEKASDLHAKLLDELGVDAGPETLKRDLEAARAFYLGDGARWRGLQALSRVAGALVQRLDQAGAGTDEVSPERLIPVPWWALQAVFMGWSQWADGQHGQADKVSLGQAFEVERSARGEPSSWEIAEKHGRQMRIATLVAEKIGCGSRPLPIDYALDFVAKDLGVEKTMVREAWREFGRPALDALIRLEDKRV